MIVKKLKELLQQLPDDCVVQVSCKDEPVEDNEAEWFDIQGVEISDDMEHRLIFCSPKVMY